MHNWGWSYEFNATKVVKPASRDELAAIIRDPQAYPSPVRALGNAHSVTECVVSNGTIVDMRGFDKILGNQTDERGRMVVRVEAGMTLIKVHEWLIEKGLELPFAAEIGDATVGSLTGSLSKDSGLGDPALSGSLYKSIVGVTYLDHEGQEVTLRDTTNGTALGWFKCSEGLLGIVVQVDLITRPAKLVRFANKVVPTADLLSAVHFGGLQVSDRKNYWLVLHPNYSFVQERALAAPGADESDAKTLAMVVNATRSAFARGVMALPLTDNQSHQPAMTWTTHKMRMVNHYGVRDWRVLYEQVIRVDVPPTPQNPHHHPQPVPKNESKKLDFSWFEYPVERFEEVVADYMAFWEGFKARYGGFEPTGWCVDGSSLQAWP
jgi:FAD/FMN-containing dehydrogenase